MTALLSPAAVRTALDHIGQVGPEAETLAIIIAAAEAYAAGSVEWGFESPQPGLTYATSNQLLVDTMSAARPDAVVLARIGLPWQREQSL